MKALHPIENRWIEVEGHTVKQITDSLNLPETNFKYALKVNGELVKSGSVSEDSVIEVVEYDPDNDTETVQSDDTDSVPQSSGDNKS